MARYGFIDPRFVSWSTSYRPASYDEVDFPSLLEPYLPNGWTAQEIVDALGLADGSIHLRGTADGPLPLERSRKGTHRVQVVRSYGRGCVQPGLRVQAGAGILAGDLALKGSGIEAWVRDNLVWIRQETASRDLDLGGVTRRSTALDLVGEALLRRAGATCPRTVLVARLRQGYQIGRLWSCPYRLWELTSGPHRLGPGVSQAFVELIWPVELYFSLRYRQMLRERAERCLAHTGSTPESFENRLLETLARAAAGDVQLLPFAFHLANIAYSGEVSGFDRARQRADDWFLRGLACALVDIWAACNLLSCVLMGRARSLDALKDRWLERLESVGAHRAIVDHFAPPLESVLTTAGDVPRRRPHHRYLFSRQHAGDVSRFFAAAKDHFEGLIRIFTESIQDLADLDRWLAGHPPDHEARLTQCYAGDIEGTQRGSYLKSLRRAESLTARYRDA